MATKTAKSSTKNGSRQEKEATPLPMYFLSLEVENARCFGQKQKLDLSDGKGKWKPWTVLLGENGVGKTTLLQILVQIYASEFSQIENDYFVLSESLKYPSIGLRIFSKEGKRLFSKLEFFFDFQGIETQSKPQVSYIEISGSQDKKRLPYLSSIKQIGFVSLVKSPIFAFGATRRMRASTLQPEHKRVSSDFLTLFSEDNFLENAEEWMLKLHLAQAFSSGKIKKENENLLSEVIQILINVLPDVVSLNVEEPTEVAEQPRILFETPYGQVTIDDLGIGHRTMIAWIVDLARRMFERYPNSPDPIAEPAVVLVDEIDLHLHPTWQRKLIGFLSERFKKTQFIVTAHSPLMVQAALDYDANVAVLRREGDHVVIENGVADRLRGLRVDQILTTVFGLMSARSPKLDTLLEERERILSKPRLTKADSARLKELREQIGEMPTGERPEDIEAMDIIRRAAAALEEGAKNGVDKNKPTKPSSKSASKTRRRGRATAAR